MADGAHFMNWKKRSEVTGWGSKSEIILAHADLSVPRYARG